MKPYQEERITGGQMAILAYATIATSGLLFLPSIIVAFAGRDAWLVPFLGAPAGFAIIGLVRGITRLYPQQSLIQAAAQALPWGAGRLLGLLLLLWMMHINSLFVRRFAEFVTGTLMPTAPNTLLVGSFLAVSAYTVILGLEVLARTAQILIPSIVILALGLTLLVLPDADAGRLQPVLAQGMAPLLQGAVPTAAWFSEAILLGLLYPRLVNPGLGWAAASGALLAGTLQFAWTGAAALSIFGLLAAYFTFPFSTLGIFAAVGDFFSRFDALIMIFWMGGLFVKITLFLYAAAAGWADWLDLPSYRPLVPALALLTGVIALTGVQNLSELSDLEGRILPLYSLSLTFGVAVLVAAGGWLQHSMRRRRKA